MAHYTQQYTRGQELKPLRVMGNWTLELILDKARPAGDCLVWDAETRYGAVRYQGKTWGVHRLAYHLATGESVDGVTVHHICANTRCVRPDHLQLASNAENVLEMLARKDYEARIAALEARVKELEAALTANGVGA